MPIRWIRRLAGVAGVVAIVGLTTAAETAIPKKTSDALVAEDIAFLQKGLAKEPQRKELPGLKATAMMVAAHAQAQMTGPNAAKMAGLRDQALKVAAALDEKEYGQAKEAAQGLENPPPSQSTKPVELHKMHDFEIDEVMAPFRSGRSGGMEIERNLRKESRTATDVKLIEAIAGRTAILGEFTKKMPTGQAAANPARLKKWEDYSDDMIGHAKAITEETAKPTPDMELLQKKLLVLDASCTNCHNDYRD